MTVQALGCPDAPKLQEYLDWFSNNETELLKATEHDVISLSMYEVAGWDRETATNLANEYEDAYGVLTRDAGATELAEFLMALSELPYIEKYQTHKNEHYEIHVSDAGVMLFFLYSSVVHDGDTVTVYRDGEVVTHSI